MARRVAILGCTGSIGLQALEVIAQDAASPERRLEVVALSAATSVDLLIEQAAACGARTLHSGAGDGHEELLRRRAGSLGGKAHVVGSVQELLDHAQPDLVLNAIVGFAGLGATVAALERGIDVALANKESLVAAGGLCMRLAREHGARIIPVDSEHSALMQCIGSSSSGEVESLVLTASGGPFFGRSRADLAGVTVEEALAHPTWNMGGKITVDSATLMNKGLELIEAMVLFEVREQDVEVVVHRDSIVHALVRHRDGSLLAHLGWPDMRVPIAWAMHWPVRPAVAAARRLDLTRMPPLEFHRPDTVAFRCLSLARDAARVGGSAPCMLNAANEVAVTSFLDGRLAFTAIAEVVEAVLEHGHVGDEPRDLATAIAIDGEARTSAVRIVEAMGARR